MNGALVTAVYRIWGEDGDIRLKTANGEGEPLEGSTTVEPRSLEATPMGEASDNPLRNVDIPKKTLYILFGVALVGTIISANVFVVCEPHVAVETYADFEWVSLLWPGTDKRDETRLYVDSVWLRISRDLGLPSMLSSSVLYGRCVGNYACIDTLIIVNVEVSSCMISSLWG